MKFCSNCGAQLNDNQSFCSNCGAKVVSNPSQPNQPPTSPVSPPPAYSQQPVQNQYNGNSAANIQPLPMKWFKFLIYFSLFFGAVANLAAGVLWGTGSIYTIQAGTSADLVYGYFAGLKAIDILYGILLIIIALFSVYTRFRLAQYRRNGPACLYALYAANACLPVLYAIAVSVVCGISQFSSVGSSVGSAILLLILNVCYFKKRKHMFIN